MAFCKIQVRAGGILKMDISFNVPNKVVDLWEEGKTNEARMELDYHITKYFENHYHKNKNKKKLES